MANKALELLTGNAIGTTFGAANSLIGGLIGSIGQKAREERQLEMQKKLNEQASELNYTYGEKAAENAFERQMQMYNRTYEDNLMKNRRKQIEDAGLSVGLMYGGSGTGGVGAGQIGGGIMGATGGANAGQATTAGQQEANRIQAMALGLQMAKQKAEIENIQANTEKTEAETTNTGANTQTTNEIRKSMVELVRQQGNEKWIDNIIKEYKMGGMEGDIETFKNANTEKVVTISKDAYLNQSTTYELGKQYAEIKKLEGDARATNAMAQLTKEKTEGYWQELMNATIHADADKIRAEATKLAAEFSTGEYTNWKTWADLARGVTGDLLNGAAKIATMGK